MAVEKQSRAYFGVVRINRLTLIVVGLLVVAMATYRFNPVERVSGLVDRFSAGKVAAGVVLEGQDVGGKSADAVRALVQSLARERAVAPQDAIVIAEGRKYEIVPDVSGRQVDVEATVAGVLAARPGDRVELVYRETPARTTMAQYPDVPVFRGNPAKQAVGFAVNVAWDRSGSLATILKSFDKAGARATFFITGRWAKANPDRVKDIVRGGHEIAIHGYDDTKEPFKMSREELVQDIALAKRTLEEISGQPVHLYSPHMSQINKTIAKVAAELNLRPVLYSLDTVDWKNPQPSVVVNRILDGAENGSIVLIHPTPSAARALDQALAGLAGRGFQILTVGELLSPSLSPATASAVAPTNTTQAPKTGTRAPLAPTSPVNAPIPGPAGVQLTPSR